MQPICQVAVIGAGTMGAAIAAHLANAGRTVLLLDIPSAEPTPAEAARGLGPGDPSVRNRIALAGLERVRTARPPALFTPETARRITCGNIEDDLPRLAEADWIIEAVTEQLAVKREVFARIDAVRRPGAIVSSNTSGLPIYQLAVGRSDDFRAHFLGTHFFNPPRQMKLLEVTPTAETRPDVVETICRLAERDLGKGVVICKDTPNFIGNRIFSMDLTFTILYALEHGYTVEEVDLLTGPLIGRPRTGTFRLLDLVGVDVMAMVGENLYPNIPTDESREILRAPRLIGLLQGMRDQGLLGNKTGAGFYREIRDGHERTVQVLDLETLAYRPFRPVRFESLAAIQAETDPGARLRALVQLADRAGQFVRAVLAHLLGYASRRLPEIADDVRAVDRAMRWGFNHELGPFEIWDALGLVEGRQLVLALDRHGVAPWVDDMIARGETRFYQTDASADRAVRYWSVADRAMIAAVEPPEVIDLGRRKAGGGLITANESASLVDLGDGVAALELHTRMNTLDARTVEMIHRALETVAAGFAGLVVTGAGPHFSAGANLREVAARIAAADWAGVERLTRELQDAFMALRFSRQPVVIAPRGWTLGGGAELAMAGSRIVAAAETYIGQVEVGVGLLPAGGGCKELLRRVVSPAARDERMDPLPALRRVFDLIARGTVAGSAAEARDLGFLAPTDRIVMNTDHVLAAAKRETLAMADAGYQPPARQPTVYAAGRDALAVLRVETYLAREAGAIEEYDAALANRIAFVLCGGDLSEPRWVTEQYILDLERAAFVELCQQPTTRERIQRFLEGRRAQ
jgi:3-hydroxyacyl-CoA dehydrogenase